MPQILPSSFNILWEYKRPSFSLSLPLFFGSSRFSPMRVIFSPLRRIEKVISYKKNYKMAGKSSHEITVLIMFILRSQTFCLECFIFFFSSGFHSCSKLQTQTFGLFTFYFIILTEQRSCLLTLTPREKINK